MAYSIICITTVDLTLRFLLLESLRHFQSSGYDVKAICAPGKHAAHIRHAGVPVMTVPMTRRITPFHDLVSLITLVYILRRERPTVVHTHTPKANLLGQIAAKLAGVPVRVSTVHGLYFTQDTKLVMRKVFEVTERLSARFAQVVFLVDKEDSETVCTLRICTNEQVRVMPGGLGIDLSKFDPKRLNFETVQQKRRELEIPDNALVIGFVGRLVREKGLLDLFAAFRSARSALPNLWLLVVGPCDSDKPDALSPEVAHDFGIGDRSVFTGMRTDVADLYALMDIFVLPSIREGLPVSTMEAQAMELPVITTDARGCRNSIVPGQTGILVPTRNSEALAQAICQLAQSPELRHKMGKAGRQLAIQRYDQRIAFEFVGQEYVRLCQTLGSLPTDLRSETNLP